MFLILTVRKFVLVLCITSTVFYTSAYLFLSQYGGAVSAAPTRKTILSWTGFFKFPRFMEPNSLGKLGCPVNNCDVTSNRTLLNNSDAVLFHWPNVNVSDLPEKTEFQHWFMLSFESPVHYPNRREAVDILGSNIDWTITYRLDSDIIAPYGQFRQRWKQDGPVPALPSPAQFGKRSSVCWMASNCRTHSKREALAADIKSHIPIAKYGKCGGKRLMLLWNRDKAFKYLGERYLFYLSFENAVCKDYVSEKAFLPLYYGLIPVVYGGANYRKHLPPNSYIDILDFPSLAKLSEHLKTVSSNYSLYTQYFEWRNKFVISKRANDNTFFCKLCANLNRRSAALNKRKGWFRLWWFNANECVNIHKRNFNNLRLIRKYKSEWY